MHAFVLFAQTGSEVDGGDAAMGMGLLLFLLLLGFAAYFFPLGIAVMRGHHNTGSIAVINIFLGWSFIGWVVALAMAFGAVDKPQPVRSRGRRRSRHDDDLY